MAEVHFYIKKPNKSGKCLISLRYKRNGQVLNFSTGESIERQNWNFKKEEVKDNNATSESNKCTINERLEKLEKTCIKSYNIQLADGRPSMDVIKSKLNNIIGVEDRNEVTVQFMDLLELFITNKVSYKGRFKTEGTLKAYKSLKKHLTSYASKKRKKITYELITEKFAEEYKTFLMGVPLQPNTWAKQFKSLIAIMNKANSLGYTTNLQHKKDAFTTSYVEADSTFLSRQEIQTLFEHDFSNNKRLEQVRDLFVFGCCVGLRFRDFSSIEPNEIIDNNGMKFINKVTKKTKKRVLIPIHPIVMQIFEKYKFNPNQLPSSISNQKFNEYIKEACRIAGLQEKGRITSEPDKELCDIISSHTARRSFATNLYLEKFPTHDIMKVTGHKTEKSFYTYIKVSELEIAQRMQEHMNKQYEDYINQAKKNK